MVMMMDATTNYISAALDNACKRVATTPQNSKSRNNTLNKESFSIGQLIGAGVLEFNEARSRLLAASAECGLPQNEATTTISSGLFKGIEKPRDLGHVNGGVSTNGKANCNGQTSSSLNKDTSNYADWLWQESQS